MEHSLQSCKDLTFLVPLNLKESDPAIPVLVYCNTHNDAEHAAEFLRSQTPAMKDKIVWVHSGMSDSHKDAIVEGFKNRSILAITSTKALGLVRKIALP